MKTDGSDPFNKFTVPPFIPNTQITVQPHAHRQSTRTKRTTEENLFCVLGNVNEPTHPSKTIWKGADVDTSLLIHLNRAQGRYIQSTSIIEIKLGRLIDDRLGVITTTKVHASRWNPPNGTTLHGKGKVAQTIHFVRDRRNSLGHSNTEIHDVSLANFLQGAAGHNRPLRKR